MHIPNWLMCLLAIVMLLLTSCQSAPPTPPIVTTCSEVTPTRAIDAQSPLVPQVVGTVKVKIEGGDGVVAVNQCTGYVYVAGSWHITVFKGAEIIGEIATKAKDIVSIAVDETANLLYAVDGYGDSVTVIRGTEVIGNVPTVGRNPTSIAIEPHSQFAYVVSGYKSRPLRDVEGNILVISGTKVIGDIALGQVFPNHVVVDPVGGYIYAGGVGGNVVVLKGLQEINRYQLTDHDLVAMDVNPHTGEVYILGHEILYRFKEGKLIDLLELVPLGATWHIRVQPITGDVYIPYGGRPGEPGKSRMKIVREMKEIGDVEVGLSPAHLDIDPVTGNVYVASFDADAVTVVNGVKVLATINVGWYPYGIGVNPANGWVYVVNTVDGTVTILGYPQLKPYP